jgi:hypothetical protein
VSWIPVWAALAGIVPTTSLLLRSVFIGGETCTATAAVPLYLLAGEVCISFGGYCFCVFFELISLFIYICTCLLDTRSLKISGLLSMRVPLPLPLFARTPSGTLKICGTFLRIFSYKIFCILSIISSYYKFL